MQYNRNFDIRDYLGPIKPSQTLDLQKLHHSHEKQLYRTKQLHSTKNL